MRPYLWGVALVVIFAGQAAGIRESRRLARRIVRLAVYIYAVALSGIPPD